jgi:hypothetical protein
MSQLTFSGRYCVVGITLAIRLIRTEQYPVNWQRPIAVQIIDFFFLKKKDNISFVS